jgi:uncharacterized protein (TIGR02996 family)
MPTLRAANSLEELSLLQAVATDLSDRTTLSVYCDWLEDRDDPRGPFLREFLRAFDERRPLPSIPSAFSSAWAEVLGLPIRSRLRNGLDARDPNMKAHLRQEYPQGFTAYEPRFDEILRSLRPAVSLVVGEAAPLETFPIGTTRVGGLPDLPVGMEWPQFPASSNVTDASGFFQFLLQIDLAEVRGTFADGLLPESGLLCFFHSPMAREPDAPPVVYYFPPGTPLRRYAPPSPKPASFDDTVEVDVSRTLTLADSLQSWKELPGGKNGEPDIDYLAEGYYDQRASGDWFCTRCPGGYEHPWIAEGIVEDLTGHLKLFELSHDGNLSWYFGDGGRLHLYVPPEEAREGRFPFAVCHEV